MEEIEVTSWLTLNALKKTAKIVETIGDLQSGHCEAVFCQIEEDLFELCYSDMAANFIRRYEDKEEFEEAMDSRRKELEEASYNEERAFEVSFENDDVEEAEDIGEETDNF